MIKSGYSALMFATITGHKAITNLLLEKNANINAQNTDGRTGLIEVIIRHG